ncbi:hypothetical protein [Nocardia sp. NPDC052112]|uniref:hypothetical protein n=1 Tax=Nocardia sp. NPDC052112 TaxID=3155646 RepID=UPI00341C2363
MTATVVQSPVRADDEVEAARRSQRLAQDTQPIRERLLLQVMAGVLHRVVSVW